jgi:hypothetical protein
MGRNRGGGSHSSTLCDRDLPSLVHRSPADERMSLGDGLPEDETPESEIRRHTFRVHTDTNAWAGSHLLARVKVQGGSHDRGRDEMGRPSH